MLEKEKVHCWNDTSIALLTNCRIARAEAKGLHNLMHCLWLCLTAHSPEQVGIEGCGGATLPSVSSAGCGAGSRGVSLFNEKSFL